MRRPRPLPVLLPLLASLAAVACESGGDGRVLGIDATGIVAGIAYLDRNGDRLPGPADAPAAGIRVGALLRGTTDTVAAATTDETGGFLLPDLPVGRYRIVVDSATVADSVEVVGIDSVELTLAADDTATVTVTIGYPTVSIAEARSFAPGRGVVLHGIALIDLATFGDLTLHFADSTGALRATRVARADILAGDSLRLVGRIATRNGQPVVTNVTPVVLAPARVPPPDSLGTARAATAEDGARDAALVRIADATIQSVLINGDGEAVLTADDGSGPLEVVLDPDAGFAGFPAPGSHIDATGVLVPSADHAGEWQLKPRSGGDIQVTAPPPDSGADGA